MRCQRKGMCSIIDGLTNSDDITECFADTYRELYASVSYDSADMQVIRDELNKSLQDLRQNPVWLLELMM